MSLTRKKAIDEILGLFKTAWDITGHGLRVKYANVGKKSVPPSGQDPWARVSLKHTNSAQASLSGAAGTRRFRRNGFVTVQIFEPPGKGLSGTIDLPKIVQDAYEGVETTSGVWFKDVTLSEVGPDGDFFQTNVVAFFEYDEIK